MLNFKPSPNEEAERYYRKHVNQLKQAQRSPDDFIEYCFTDPQGEPLRQANVHRELQAFLSNHRKALIELPRDHGKSVQICARLVWELGHNPALRIKYVCATDSIAIDRSRYIRDAIVNNAKVSLVFPDLRPASPWTANAFTIERPANAIGPSVAAFGVGTGSTGARADLLVGDDLVDVRAIHSKTERERMKVDFTNNLMNLLEPDGRYWGLSTPWHPDDLNAELRANPAYALFRRAVGPNLEPVWIEKWPSEKLSKRRDEIGEASFARGYRLLPVEEGELLIRSEWVKFWIGTEPLETVVLAVDPAVSAKASADASALVVAGRLPRSNAIRVLQAQACRMTTPDLVARIAELDRIWKPDAILFESNAAFAGIRDLLIHQTSFGPRLRSVVQSKSKLARFSGFSVIVQNGTFQLKGDRQVDPSQRELYDEMKSFPFGRHDDLLDAAAIAADHLLTRSEPRVWV